LGEFLTGFEEFAFAGTQFSFEQIALIIWAGELGELLTTDRQQCCENTKANAQAR
jgi:hypothetical protein